MPLVFTIASWPPRRTQPASQLEPLHGELFAEACTKLACAGSSPAVAKTRSLR